MPASPSHTHTHTHSYKHTPPAVTNFSSSHCSPCFGTPVHNAAPPLALAPLLWPLSADEVSLRFRWSPLAHNELPLQTHNGVRVSLFLRTLSLSPPLHVSLGGSLPRPLSLFLPNSSPISLFFFPPALLFSSLRLCCFLLSEHKKPDGGVFVVPFKCGRGGAKGQQMFASHRIKKQQLGQKKKRKNHTGFISRFSAPTPNPRH